MAIGALGMLIGRFKRAGGGDVGVGRDQARVAGRAAWRGRRRRRGRHREHRAHAHVGRIQRRSGRDARVGQGGARADSRDAAGVATPRHSHTRRGRRGRRRGARGGGYHGHDRPAVENHPTRRAGFINRRRVQSTTAAAQDAGAAGWGRAAAPAVVHAGAGHAGEGTDAAGDPGYRR